MFKKSILIFAVTMGFASFGFSVAKAAEDSTTQSASGTAGTSQAVSTAVNPDTPPMPVTLLPELSFTSLAPPIAVAVKSAVDAANTAIASCNTKSGTAASFCLASSSPAIHSGILMLGGIMSLVGPSTTVSESCATQSKAMSAAKVAMTAYAVACSAVQMPCDTACGTAIKSIAAIDKALGKTVAPEISAAALKSSADATQALKKCEGYKYSMGAAAAGILAMIKESKANKTCAAATTVVDCIAKPEDPSCVKGLTPAQIAENARLAELAKQDCTRVENANTPACICQRTPTMAGCAGAGSGNSEMSSFGNSNPSPGATAPSGPSLNSSTNSNLTGANSGTNAGAGAHGMAGGNGGGGSGSGGLSGGGGAAAGKTKAADGKAALNANILQGYDGGGGGGGGSGGARLAGNSDYNAFLPGGAKDPNRNPANAAAAAFKSQVTEAGSKSNWEKVSERYQENKPSLMQGP